MSKDNRRRTVGPALLLHASNLDGTTRRSLEVFFDSACRGRFGFGDAEDAHLGLVDLDAVNGDFELSRYQQLHPGRPVVALGSSPSQPADVVVLTKPLVPRDLRRVLDQHADLCVGTDETGLAMPGAAPAATPSHVGSGEDLHPSLPRTAESASLSFGAPVDDVPAVTTVGALDGAGSVVTSPTTRRSARLHGSPRPGGRSAEAALRAMDTFEPDLYLLGAVRSAWKQAREAHRAFEVELRGARLVVGAGGELTEMHCTRTQVRLAASRPGRATTRRIRDAASRQQPVVVRTEQLLWDLAVWTSQGRLWETADVAAPLRLRHWPDLPRCSPLPGAVEVCARLSGTSHSVSDLIDRGLDPSSVVLVHSALMACDLVEVDLSEPLPRPEGPDAQRRGLLRRIVAHLRAG